jgi:3-oxoacyl-[acyl-carrier protein] reductase
MPPAAKSTSLFAQKASSIDPHKRGERSMDWHEQVALVTGASRGIGRAAAERLAKRGAAVAVNYVARAAEAESLAHHIIGTGGRAFVVGADVGDREQVSRMVDRVAAELGPISILVNNAGVVAQATLETYDPAAMEAMRRINVDGLIHVTRAVAPAMRAKRYGRIVNITSIAGHGTAMPGNAFYAATKAAVSVLTRRFAMELGADGVTVNAVAPGVIITDMSRANRNEAELQEFIKKMIPITMVGRVGEPDDIAHAVAFLAAPESGFITGQILTVDGGRMDYIGHP